MKKSLELYNKAKRIIPGGTQLLSKRPEMFLPDFWPSYYSKSKGCLVWDLDSNKYIDMSYMGIGTNILGYADDDVNKQVQKVINYGNCTTLNAPEEIELAELLLELHSWADMVRYARTGGEAMAIAVRIARAKTRKELVLFCGYHGWHDWYLAANIKDINALDDHLIPGLSPLGVPECLKGTAIPFRYNDIESFNNLMKEYGNKVGAIIIEPIRNYYPDGDFLKTIRKAADSNNIVFIIDEITAGWRLHNGGAHMIFNIEPDIAVFGKGMSNGFPMAAIIGKEEVMQVVQDTFISSTYWTDRIGPTAAIASIKKMIECKVPEHLISVGKEVQEGWENSGNKYDIELNISGILPLGHFSFNYSNSQVIKTLFVQLMLERGFLATTAYYASYAHKKEHVDSYLLAVEESFSIISDSIKKGNSDKYLKGSICHQGFQRLT